MSHTHSVSTNRARNTEELVMIIGDWRLLCVEGLIVAAIDTANNKAFDTPGSLAAERHSKAFHRHSVFVQPVDRSHMDRIYRYALQEALRKAVRT